MLELIRRLNKNGMLLLIAILTIIAFAFLYNPDVQDTPDSRPYMTIGDRTVTSGEKELLDKSQGILYAMQKYQYAFAVSSLAQKFANQDPNERNTDDFVINTILLRDEAKKLGVSVGDWEINDEIKSQQAFLTEGEFDPTKWKNVLRNLKAQGINEEFVRQSLADAIRYDKLKELVAPAVAASPRGIEERYEDQQAKIFSSVATFKQTDYEEGIEVTDEEIQAYYDENKDGFQSEPMRAIDYVFFKKPTAADFVPDTIVDGEEAPDATAELEAKTKEYAEVVYAFDTAFTDTSDEAAPLETIVADAQYAEFMDGGLKTTEPFPQASPPAEIATERQLVSGVFSTISSTDIGTPVETPGGYYFFRITERKEPAQQELEEVKEDIVKTLTSEKKADAASVAAAEAKEKIDAALAAGKTFAEAAEEAGATATEIKMFTSGQNPVGVADGGQIKQTMASLKNGEVSAPVDTPTGALLVYLESRELPLDPQNVEATKATIATALNDVEQSTIFQNWFRTLKDKANPSRL
ncbi:peptidyl-prolyl cis-trans isomerase [Verrucomicrobiales bacterium]|nr:peptidyl-prolyl cis-trans isomerase [Verrucomicrobiales bacterium]